MNYGTDTEYQSARACIKSSFLNQFPCQPTRAVDLRAILYLIEFNSMAKHAEEVSRKNRE